MRLTNRQLAYIVALYITGMLIAAVAISCFSAPGPETRGIEVNRDIHKVYHQDKAMLFMEGIAEDRFNVQLPNVWEDTKIWWSDSKCPHSDNYAVVHKGECFAGKMWSCGEMYVAVSGIDPERTCGTALLHEFGHCLAGVIFQDFDGDHDGPIWAVVDEAYARACEEGW